MSDRDFGVFWTWDRIATYGLMFGTGILFGAIAVLLVAAGVITGSIPSMVAGGGFTCLGLAVGGALGLYLSDRYDLYGRVPGKKSK